MSWRRKERNVSNKSEKKQQNPDYSRGGLKAATGVLEDIYSY